MGDGLFQKSINCGCSNAGIFFWQFEWFDGLFHRKLLIPWTIITELRFEGDDAVEFLAKDIRIKLISGRLVEWMKANRMSKPTSLHQQQFGQSEA